MNERDLALTLHRLIRGELASTAARSLANRAGYRTFAELIDSTLPEELGAVRLTASDVVTRIERFRAGGIDLGELGSWADELYNIAYGHRFHYEPDREEEILTALSVLSVACNRRLFPLRHTAERALGHVYRGLSGERALDLRRVFERAFEELPTAHLATRCVAAQSLEGGAADEDDEPSTFENPAESFAASLGSAPDPLEGVVDADPSQEGLREADVGSVPDGSDRWVEVVLLDRPFEPGGDEEPPYSWILAFSVVTWELFNQELTQQAAGEDGGPPPQERLGRDRVPELRRLVPNFRFDRYSPVVVHDADGIAEIALDAPGIGLPEVGYAAKLFALMNRIGRVLLNGDRLSTLLVRPVRQTRRARRRRRDQR